MLAGENQLHLMGMVLAFLLLVLDVATDSGQHLAVLGEHGVQDAAAERPAALVAASIVWKIAAAPLRHRLGRKAGVAADVRRGCRIHYGDVANEFFVDIM